jgi:signal transduction histidine kinase
MNSFFRKLPLSIKLMLIGLIPVLFLIYLSGQLYNEKKQKVKLIADYIEHIHESQNIAKLMSELENERKYSYEYALKKINYSNIILQRPRTDAVIALLNKSKDLAISNFAEYTFIYKLSAIRSSIDSSGNYPADAVMKYYTGVISRLNTLNSVASASNTYLQPVYKDLIAQKTLFEMSTSLGVLRTNIYTALYTKKYNKETFSSSVRTYDVLKSYETEFLLKASPASVRTYKDLKDSTALKPTLAYIDALVTTLIPGSALSAEQWWSLSSKGADVLKKQELDLGATIETGMNQIYQEEVKSRNKTLIFLIAAIILVISFVIYNIRVISKMLSELKVAAQKISLGGTGLKFHNMSNDAMGSLADSILEIDRNNIELAHAANSIGTGNFDVPVNPRSDEDLLGNSIQKMKEDLHKLTLEKDKVQKETLELVNRKDDFLSIASHELKTPVTSLKAYTQLLQMDAKENGDSKREMMFLKMDSQVDKLTALITDLLDTSKMQNGKLVYNNTFFQLNELIKEVVDEMKATNVYHNVIIEKNVPLQLYADRDRISQVLTNLLSNAIKYCPDCKKIIVKLENDAGMAICSVQDFGNGIIKAQQDKIFERFYRVTGNNLHTYPGLGLGLFIAKEIIERHDGKIWFESEEGKGSIFYFSLPIAVNQEKIAQEKVMHQ